MVNREKLASIALAIVAKNDFEKDFVEEIMNIHENIADGFLLGRILLPSKVSISVILILVSTRFTCKISVTGVLYDTKCSFFLRKASKEIVTKLIPAAVPISRPVNRAIPIDLVYG